MKLNMERKLEHFGFSLSLTDLDQIILSCTGSEEDKYRVSAKLKAGELMFEEVYEDTLDAIMTFRHKLDGFLKGGYREVKEFCLIANRQLTVTGGCGGGTTYYTQITTGQGTHFEVFGAGGGGGSSWGQASGGVGAVTCGANSCGGTPTYATVNSNTSILESPDTSYNKI